MAITKNKNLYRGMQDASGSTDVLDLQKALNATGYGYNLREDGIFGAKTESAVKNYQERTGLKVDGIAGENTLGALSAGTSVNTQSNVQNNMVAESPKSYRYDYESDPVYQAALQKKEDVAASAPVLEKTFDQQVQDLFDQVVNQKPFEYDLNGDALWQQYKDQNVTQGKLAMMDTMGQATALTGGYGSSYAQNVGQQAYQGQLQKMNEQIPALYQLALQKYNNDQTVAQNKLAAAMQMREDEYGRYQDALGQHNIALDRAQSEVDAAYDRGNNAWMTEEQLRREDENTAYSKQQTNYEKLANLIASSGYTPSREELTAAGMSATEANAYGKIYSDAKKQARSTGSRATSTGDEDNSAPAFPEVSSNITTKVASFTNNTDLANYLDGLTASGIITEEQADALYAEYKQVDKAALSDRSWTLADDGGVNWFWGIDNNATVKDQYGNTYRLDKLVDALVADGMDKSAAKDYVKKLQAKLGA